MQRSDSKLYDRLSSVVPRGLEWRAVSGESGVVLYNPDTVTSCHFLFNLLIRTTMLLHLSFFSECCLLFEVGYLSRIFDTSIFAVPRLRWRIH